nr:serine hydrolase domain-containing protein [Auraticoccus cholistanensis]
MLLAVAVVLGLAVGVLLRPAPSRLPEQVSGDAGLAARARAVLGEDHRALAVAVVGPGGTRTAVIGAPAGARFETGSISKGVTGLLLAQALERGEVRETTRVAELVPELAGAPVGEVELRQLATHTSGLPVQPVTAGQLGRNLWATASGANPYPASEAERLATLRGTPLSQPPGTYSNLGFEVLGLALARAAGTSYPELARERVLEPLGMDAAGYPTSPDELGALDLRGESGSGRVVQPWLGQAMAPAGGLRADVGDMARLAGALLDGSAPGVDALEPRQAFRGHQIGWAWITSEAADGSRHVWHDGGTGGFSSWLGVDRDRGTAVVVLSATADPVDEGAEELLRTEGSR